MLERKPIKEIDDNTIILADVSEKAIRQVKATVTRLLNEQMGMEQAEKIAAKLTSGTWTHDFPITVEEARELGLSVSTEMPKEIYKWSTSRRRARMSRSPDPHVQAKAIRRGKLEHTSHKAESRALECAWEYKDYEWN